MSSDSASAEDAKMSPDEDPFDEDRSEALHRTDVKTLAIVKSPKKYQYMTHSPSYDEEYDEGANKVFEYDSGAHSSRQNHTEDNTAYPENSYKDDYNEPLHNQPQERHDSRRKPRGARNSEQNAEEIDRAVALANQYPDIIKIIAVGDECI